MEMMNRAIDGAALFKDMMNKVKAKAQEEFERTDPEVAAWNAEVDRARAEKMERRIKAHNDLLRAELQKASQR